VFLDVDDGVVTGAAVAGRGGVLVDDAVRAVEVAVVEAVVLLELPLVHLDVDTKNRTFRFVTMIVQSLQLKYQCLIKPTNNTKETKKRLTVYSISIMCHGGIHHLPIIFFPFLSSNQFFFSGIMCCMNMCACVRAYLPRRPVSPGSALASVAG